MGRTKRQKILIIGFVLFQFLYVFQNTNVLVLATETADVDATVKLGVCGDGVKEGAEECDDTDFGATSCSTYDYDAGTLLCEIDCTANTSGCTLSPSDDSDNSDSDDSSSNSGNGNENDETITRSFIIRTQALLPRLLAQYDSNSDNVLEFDEIVDSLATWANLFRADVAEVCDLNADQHCTIIDFSILLYHIQQ